MSSASVLLETFKRRVAVLFHFLTKPDNLISPLKFRSRGGFSSWRCQKCITEEYASCKSCYMKISFVYPLPWLLIFRFFRSLNCIITRFRFISTSTLHRLTCSKEWFTVYNQWVTRKFGSETGEHSWTITCVKEKNGRRSSHYCISSDIHSLLRRRYTSSKSKGALG